MRCDDARMPHRFAASAGLVLSGAGLLAAVASLAVPWGRYRATGSAYNNLPVAQDGPVAVFVMPGGSWYLLVLGVLVTLLVLAAFGTGRAPRIALTAAPAAGIVGALVVITIVNHFSGRTADVVATGLAEVRVVGETAAGVWLGVLAGPLLGFGTGAVALARGRAAADPAARTENVYG